jgi:beta-lactam-binding protein with PASTA domain
VIWYDVPPRDEAAFERYRRLLKGLARDGTAAVIDVVSRPGARYVAWRVAAADLPTADDASLGEAIRGAGLDPARADVRRDGRSSILVDLRFEPGASASDPRATHAAGDRPHEPEAPQARSLAERLRHRSLAERLRHLRRRRLTNDALSWVVAAALFATAIAAFGGGFLARANDRLIRVPDLAGAVVHDASRRLADLGLRVDAVAVASQAEHGTVLTLEPGAGTALRPGRSVRITYGVSPGHLAPATVPDVVGTANDDQATARLEAAGLRLGRIARVHADAPAGAVLAQSAPAGSTLGQGQGIDLVTSLGPRTETTFLPDLVGLDVEDARYLVTVAGLTSDQVVIEHVEHDREPAGRVLAQSLAPYARVPRAEATVRLLVVAEPTAARPPTGLPSLAGLALDDARSLAAGFDVRVETIEDRTLPDGVVLQSLPVGARASDGPLILTVNVRPVPVPRPVPSVHVREPEVRRLEFTWFIEPGIPTQSAEVRARTLRGDDVVVLRAQVRGGETVRGTWTTTAPGPVRFSLTLNREPYGGDVLVP